MNTRGVAKTARNAQYKSYKNTLRQAESKMFPATRQLLIRLSFLKKQSSRVGRAITWDSEKGDKTDHIKKMVKMDIKRKDIQIENGPHVIAGVMEVFLLTRKLTLIGDSPHIS